MYSGGRNHPLQSTSQKKYLESYAQQQGFQNCVHYTDDGYSGGNFDCPAWKRLMNDIEAGRVSVVLAKDMSRIGRDYLQTGFYTEVFFRQRRTIPCSGKKVYGLFGIDYFWTARYAIAAGDAKLPGITTDTMGTVTTTVSPVSFSQFLQA